MFEEDEPPEEPAPSPPNPDTEPDWLVLEGQYSPPNPDDEPDW
jgi:hypothetical protein